MWYNRFVEQCGMEVSAMSQAALEISTSRPILELASPVLLTPARRVVRKPPDKKWTAEDLLALAGDENRYELVRGELVMMTPAGPKHGKFASRLDRAIGNYVETHNLGEVYTAEPGFQLQAEPLTIRAPEVAFVQRLRIPAGEPAGFWSLAPDLVVEIISPSETAQDVHEKVKDYLRAGTRLIWLVYPDNETVMEYRAPEQARVLTADDDLQGGDVLPGFRHPLKQLFRK
jgi:Uma2 family endonuclease